MMKNPLKALEVKENDGLMTAAGKGGVKGTIIGTLISGVLYGTVWFIGARSDKAKNIQIEDIIEDIKEEA